MGLGSAPQLADRGFEFGVLLVGAVRDDLCQDDPSDTRAGKDEADSGNAV